MIKFRPNPKRDFLTEKLNRKITQQRDKTNAARSHAFFFKSVWNSNPHICFECGIPIPFFDKRFVHHLIEKRLQNRYSINLDNTENGVLACWTCHDQVMLNIDKTPKIKAATIIILQKYSQYLIKDK